MAARRKRHRKLVTLFNSRCRRNPWEHDPAEGGAVWTKEGHWEWTPDFNLRIGGFLYKIPYDWAVRDQVAKKLGYRGTEPMAWFQSRQTGTFASTQALYSLTRWLDSKGFERSRKQASNPRGRKRRKSTALLSGGLILGGKATDILKILRMMEKELSKEERRSKKHRSSGRKSKRRSKKNPVPLGTGARFKALVKKLKTRKGYHVRDPRALAAWIGRRKYGAKKFQQLAARGKWRHRVAKLHARARAANPRRRSRRR